MKFIINRDELLTPLQQIVSVIEKKQTMPVLSNLLIQVNEDHVVLIGTDLEIQMVAKLSLLPVEVGNITVPARKLLDICRLLPATTEINVELKEDKVKILGGRSRFSLSTLPADIYPEFSDLEGDSQNSFVMNAGQLKKALSKTLFSMANQDVRYYLNGMLLHISNKRIKFVASDGHRLAFYEDEIEQATGLEQQMIVPRKGVQELSRLLDDNETDVEIRFSSNNIKITYQNLVFSAKLVDAKYPDFSRIYSQPLNNPIQIQKQLLLEALTRIAVLSHEKLKGISLDVSENLLRISTHNPEHDEAEEEVIMDYEGQAFSISFNVQYLMDAVSNLDSELAILNIAVNNSCCFVEEPEFTGYKFIVMPMQL